MTAALVTLTLAVLTQEQPQFSVVFTAHEHGFASIRIPSVVVTNRGTILAFAEGRGPSQNDQGSNKIILKRSKDGGVTWSPIQIVDDRGRDSLNNPCAVVERTTGTVFLMYQRLPAGLSERGREITEGYDGPNIYRSYVTSSRDDGRSWSKPEDITPYVKRPNRATTICSGPGVGIQLVRGRRAGRLIVPFNEGPFFQWNNYAVYSDDLGKTWNYGANVPYVFIADEHNQVRSQVNEAQVVELSDGSVLLNSRQFAGEPVRKQSISTDGGETWSPMADAAELRDPSCMGSISRLSSALGIGAVFESNVLLYSGPDSENRENGTIYASFDDGKTWPVKRVLVPGPFAYSVLTRLKPGTLGCLFEGAKSEIDFATFPDSWIVSAPASR